MIPDLPQSDRCHPRQDFSNSLHRPAFERMLAEEARRWPEYHVFYHVCSYRSHPLLYEVYAALAALAYGVDPPAPLPRLAADGFLRYPSLDTILSAWPGTDHDMYVKRVLISAQPTLFSSLECQPISIFPVGYCAGAPFSDRDGVTKLLKACGCLEKVVLEVLKLWKERYHMSERDLHLTGHMLQIFVNRAVVDQVAYPCVEYGKVAKSHLPISRFLSQKVIPPRVQTRLYAHPRYFLDPQAVQLCYYCAHPPFNRPEFAQALRQILAPAVHRPRLRTLVPPMMSEEEPVPHAELAAQPCPLPLPDCPTTPKEESPRRRWWRQTCCCLASGLALGVGVGLGIGIGGVLVLGLCGVVALPALKLTVVVAGSLCTSVAFGYGVLNCPR